MIFRAIHFNRVAMATACVIASFVPLRAPAASTAAYGVVKEQDFDQTSSAAPILKASQAYLFSAFAVATGSNELSAVSLRVGANNPFALARETNSGSFFFTERFDLQDDLDAAYPGGNTTYTMSITGIDGFHQTQLKFLSDQYPNTPRITNYAAAQAIVTSGAFTFDWDPFSGGTTNDIIQLVMTDDQTNVVYTSPGIGATNGLDGTSNSVTIAANTLQAGRSYHGSLLFGKVLPSSSLNQLIYYPGVRDVVGYARLTSFDIHTAASSPPFSRLEVLTNNAAGAALHFTTSTGFVYRLETSTNLVGWSTLLTTNPVTTNVIYTDSTAIGLSAKYYRVSSP